MHWKHQTGSHWRGRSAAIVAATARPLIAAGAAGILAAALLTTGVLAGATPAGAAPAPHKSAALARAKATGFAGLKGGHGSGKAVGRSRVTRTPKPPALTPAEKRTQRQAAQRPILGPAKAQGRSAAQQANPTSRPLAAAKATGHTSPRSRAAPTDFEYYRAQNVTPGDGQSGVNEPSVANDGNDVLYTGNWYAAQSTNSGNSFSYINPYTLGPTPTLPNGGFCCDQVAIHAAWGLLYCPVNSCNSGDNLIRLAVARNQADLASDTFDYYDFSAQTFGFPAGDWLDYPHFGVNADYLMLSMNVFNGGTFVDSIMVKFDLSSFLTGGWSANWGRPTRTPPGPRPTTAPTPGPTGPRPRMRTAASSVFTTGLRAPTTPT
jgi:hypothetical protein